jgi:protein transport protein SEC24
MLYTNIFGETRIRVFNMAYEVETNLHQYLKMAVAENYVQYFLKEKLVRVSSIGCKQVREEILNHVVDVLYIYRKQCAHNSSPTQLVIPESLKLFAIYI